MKEEPQN